VDDHFRGSVETSLAGNGSEAVIGEVNMRNKGRTIEGKCGERRPKKGKEGETRKIQRA